jgi:hypothetical protein
MRTALFLLAGFLLLAAFLLLGKLFSATFAEATRWATGIYIVLWLLVAAGNMWAGVAKAGYSVAEELPILLLIFGVPAALAILLKWKFL